MSVSTWIGSTFGGGGPPLVWILATGIWNDAGGWDDSAAWID